MRAQKLHGLREYYRSRADTAGEKIRAYLLAMNSGAIATVLTVSGIVNQSGWAMYPAACFGVGLFATGACLFMSKLKYIKLQKRELNEFSSRFFWWHWIYDLVAFLCFITGAIIAFISLPEHVSEPVLQHTGRW